MPPEGVRGDHIVDALPLEAHVDGHKVERRPDPRRLVVEAMLVVAVLVRRLELVFESLVAGEDSCPQYHSLWSRYTLRYNPFAKAQGRRLIWVAVAGSPPVYLRMLSTPVFDLLDGKPIPMARFRRRYQDPPRSRCQTRRCRCLCNQVV